MNQRAHLKSGANLSRWDSMIAGQEQLVDVDEIVGSVPRLPVPRLPVHEDGAWKIMENLKINTDILLFSKPSLKKW